MTNRAEALGEVEAEFARDRFYIFKVLCPHWRVFLTQIGLGCVGAASSLRGSHKAMSNAEPRALLARGVDAWNQWRQEAESRAEASWKASDRINLREARLRQAQLSQINLSSVDCCMADLRHADLRHSNLREALLYTADLSYADLGSAILTGADLREALLHDANLEGADRKSVV